MVHCECRLENMEKQYIIDAEAAGVDVTSSFEGREGTSVDAFHSRHLQLAMIAQPLSFDQEGSSSSNNSEPPAYDILSKPKSRKKFMHPYGSGEAWR